MDGTQKEQLMTPGPAVPAPEITPSLRLSSLTRREENSVIELRRKQACQRCAASVGLFSECSAQYTVGVVWKCRALKDIMNECLRRANTVDDMDRARSIFLDEKQKGLAAKKDKPRTLI
ncbi:hypothetical protein LPJ66_001345 [Kickxella alabastrina]|uniref:Uncharacterized protein n=1 Tax=Kickxella alabastrina TaxID=61397 RepID=A0ACC1ITJ8_9FUNG|nr:hypothetical protein LPJ66_001345 [Kickxella alabastrina]